MIRIVERCRTASEGGIVEVPFRRSQLPDKLRKLLPVPCVAGLAPFGGEIVLVPPFEFGLRRQRHPARLTAADQIATHGDKGCAAFRPKRRNDAGSTRSEEHTSELQSLMPTSYAVYC